MAEATLSSKNQIVVPREALGVHPGDKLLIVRGKTVVILPRPSSWTKALRGLANEPYPEGYLNEERDSWDVAGTKQLLASGARVNDTCVFNKTPL